MDFLTPCLTSSQLGLSLWSSSLAWPAWQPQLCCLWWSPGQAGGAWGWGRSGQGRTPCSNTWRILVELLLKVIQRFVKFLCRKTKFQELSILKKNSYIKESKIKFWEHQDRIEEIYLILIFTCTINLVSKSISINPKKKKYPSWLFLIYFLGFRNII